MGARLSCVLVVLGTLGCGGGDDPVQALLQGLPPDLTISCDPDGGTVFRGTVDLTPVLELGAGFDRLFMRIQDIAGPLAFRVDGQPFDPLVDEWEFTDPTRVELEVIAADCEATEAGFEVLLERTGAERGEVRQRETHAVAVEFDETLAAPDTLAVLPQLASAGPNVCAAWVERDSISLESTVVFRRSPDRGATWEPRVELSDNDLSAAEVWLCASGGVVFAAWTDTRLLASRTTAIHLRRSADGGATWEAQRVVQDPVAFAGPTDNLRVSGFCCDGDRVYVLWEQETGFGAETLYARASNDGGATWYDRVTLATDGTSVPVTSALACDGERAYVAWGFGGFGSDATITFHRSVDGGQTFSTPIAAPFGGNDGTGGNDGYNPRFCTDGDAVYLLALRRVDADSDGLFIWASRDGTDTWAVAGTRVDRTGIEGAADPRLVCRGESVDVVWSDPLGEKIPVLANRSANLGATWLASDVRLDGDGSVSDRPVIARTGDDVHIAWRENRTNVWYRPPGGAAPRRLDTDPTGEIAGLLAATASDGRFHVAWTDPGVSGTPDVFVNSFEPSGAPIRGEERTIGR